MSQQQIDAELGPAVFQYTSNSSAGGAYQQLREGLIWGRWKPGEKLKPQHLKQVFEYTSGALREALIRLAGEGFVQFEEQRGFSTVKPSRKSFQEIRDLRVLLECEGARLSILNGDLEWEANLIAAHHKLVHLEEKMRGEKDISGFIKIWSRYDWEVHQSLVAACNSDHLKEYYRAVFDKFRLHAVSELRAYGFRGKITISEHAKIVSHALARDAASCAEAIDDHLRIYRRASSSA